MSAATDSSAAPGHVPTPDLDRPALEEDSGNDSDGELEVVVPTSAPSPTSQQQPQTAATASPSPEAATSSTTSPTLISKDDSKPSDGTSIPTTTSSSSVGAPPPSASTGSIAASATPTATQPIETSTPLQTASTPQTSSTSSPQSRSGVLTSPSTMPSKGILPKLSKLSSPRPASKPIVNSSDNDDGVDALMSLANLASKPTSNGVPSPVDKRKRTRSRDEGQPSDSPDVKPEEGRGRSSSKGLIPQSGRHSPSNLSAPKANAMPSPPPTKRTKSGNGTNGTQELSAPSSPSSEHKHKEESSLSPTAAPRSTSNSTKSNSIFPNLRNCTRHIAVAMYIFQNQKNQHAAAGQKPTDPTLEARKLKEKTEWSKRQGVQQAVNPVPGSAEAQHMYQAAYGMSPYGQMMSQQFGPHTQFAQQLQQQQMATLQFQQAAQAAQAQIQQQAMQAALQQQLQQRLLGQAAAAPGRVMPGVQGALMTQMSGLAGGQPMMPGQSMPGMAGVPGMLQHQMMPGVNMSLMGMPMMPQMAPQPGQSLPQTTAQPSPPNLGQQLALHQQQLAAYQRLHHQQQQQLNAQVLQQRMLAHIQQQQLQQAMSNTGRPNSPPTGSSESSPSALDTTAAALASTQPPTSFGSLAVNAPPAIAAPDQSLALFSNPLSTGAAVASTAPVSAATAPSPPITAASDSTTTNGAAPSAV